MLDETGRFLGTLFVACAAFLGCGLCKDDTITESQSPGGKYVASVVEQDCGATTDYTSHVRIRLSDSWLRQGDDVLVVDYRQDIRLNWVGDDRLQVEFRKCASDKQGLRIQSELRRWNDRVEIERREGDPLDPDSPECRK